MVDDRCESRRATPELLEDGTLPFQQICALETALPFVLALGYPEVGMHTAALRQWTATKLMQIRRPDGGPAVVIYGAAPDAPSTQTGPTIAFNVVGADGRVLGISSVGHMAALARLGEQRLEDLAEQARLDGQARRRKASMAASASSLSSDRLAVQSGFNKSQARDLSI